MKPRGSSEDKLPEMRQLYIAGWPLRKIAEEYVVCRKQLAKELTNSGVTLVRGREAIDAGDEGG